MAPKASSTGFGCGGALLFEAATTALKATFLAGSERRLRLAARGFLSLRVWL